MKGFLGHVSVISKVDQTPVISGAVICPKCIGVNVGEYAVKAHVQPAKLEPWLRFNKLITGSSPLILKVTWTFKTDISFVDSIVGKDIVIPYFKEKINVNTNIFGVISNGKNYLLEGKGMPILNTSNKGNMFIEFSISYPKIKNNTKIDELKALLNEVFY